MDPAVQVAIVSVFATLVTTLGVVAVAIINKKGDHDREEGPDELDVNDILSRLVSMAAEIQRKEASIQKLQGQLSEARRRISFLEQFIDEQKRGSSNERADRSP